MHGRWKVTRYRLFSHTMSLGATRSWHDRVKRETDRVLPTKRKYLLSKRFRAYLEMMKSFTSFYTASDLREYLGNSIERVSNIVPDYIIWAYYSTP